MKIAFFSDVHANLPALEVVKADINQEKPERVYCLGDLVGYYVWPQEVVNLVRAHQVPILMGNHEESLQITSPVQGKNSAIT